jgi:hypothetical protein
MLSRKIIGQPGKNLESLSSAMEQLSLNSIRKVLPDQAIAQACRQAHYGYRRRKLTPLITVWHLLLSAFWPESSFQSSWQVLWDQFVSHCPWAGTHSPSSGSVAKARSRLPLGFWRHLWAWMRGQVETATQTLDRWRGLRVVLLDGTCPSMPDTPKLKKFFGCSRGYHGRSRYPVARLVTLSLAFSRTVLAYALGPYKKDENALAAPLLRTLRKGDLLLADRHFAAAHFYARYQQSGLEFVTRVHQCFKVKRLKPYWYNSRYDFVADMPSAKKYRQADPSLPKEVRLRFIRTTVRGRSGRQTIWLVTSLIDELAYPAREIVALYGMRWRIETLFAELKIHLGADVLRSKTAAGIYKEVAARMLALNVVRLIMLEAAAEHQVDPLRLSFVHALRAILSFAPALAEAPPWKLPAIYQAMLAEIAAHTVPLRPGRQEPRAVRREPKNYPSLRCTRQQWRLQNVA